MKPIETIKEKSFIMIPHRVMNSVELQDKGVDYWFLYSVFYNKTLLSIKTSKEGTYSFYDEMEQAHFFCISLEELSQITKFSFKKINKIEKYLIENSLLKKKRNGQKKSKYFLFQTNTAEKEEENLSNESDCGLLESFSPIGQNEQSEDIPIIRNAQSEDTPIIRNAQSENTPIVQNEQSDLLIPLNNNIKNYFFYYKQILTIQSEIPEFENQKIIDLEHSDKEIRTSLLEDIDLLIEDFSQSALEWKNNYDDDVLYDFRCYIIEQLKKLATGEKTGLYVMVVYYYLSSYLEHLETGQLDCERHLNLFFSSMQEFFHDYILEISYPKKIYNQEKYFYKVFYEFQKKEVVPIIALLLKKYSLKTLLKNN